MSPAARVFTRCAFLDDMQAIRPTGQRGRHRISRKVDLVRDDAVEERP
jgi:hypothetical protein